MSPPDALFDWHRLHAAERGGAPAVDSRRRLWIGMAGFVMLLVAVFARAVALEVTRGEAFREQAARSLSRQKDVPGLRGRILARDGSVLACDKKVQALAVHYRYLQEPPNARWLRLAARARLSKAQRQDRACVAAEEARLRAARRDLGRRLSSLVGISPQEWGRRAAAVESRVERISDTVNRRRQDAFERRQAREEDDDADDDDDRPAGVWDAIGRFVMETLYASMDEPAPARVIVAEELDYHVMAEDVPLEVVAEIEAHPDRYPGVRIVESSRRDYPGGPLAAHLLGYLGPAAEEDLSAGGADDGERYHAGDRLGRSGLERTYEQLLRGRHGVAVERIDHAGRVLSSYRQQEPGVGRDLRLTLDPALQRAAEELLAAAIRRRSMEPGAAAADGGAALVMDVHNGAILAAASAPAFDPNLFSGGSDEQIAALLRDPAHPLFDRASQMAIPPGSVFKTVTAVALVDQHAVGPYEPFECRGYLHQPDRLRCRIFTHTGRGHGEVTLLDALAQSCNVYFFHHAASLGPDALVHWALQLGFGRRTGVDLPGEAAGNLPSPRSMGRQGRQWRTGDTQMLAVGQGKLQATPLQVARMIAAVANGGRLVTPHAAAGLGLPQSADDRADAAPAETGEDPIRIPPSRPIPGLDPGTLDVVRRGLVRVVADHLGTAHGTVYLDSVEIAGKTGTAETGAGDHAWFAGYVPADRPRLAIVVVLEHAGSGAEAAGPVVRRLVLRMDQLGYFGRK